MSELKREANGLLFDIGNYVGGWFDVHRYQRTIGVATLCVAAATGTVIVVAANQPPRVIAWCAEGKVQPGGGWITAIRDADPGDRADFDGTEITALGQQLGRDYPDALPQPWSTVAVGIDQFGDPLDAIPGTCRQNFPDIPVLEDN